MWLVNSKTETETKLIKFFSLLNLRFNDRRFQIDNGDPPFPRKSGKWWFGCKKEAFALRDDEGGVFKLSSVKKQDQKQAITSTFDLVDGDLDLDVIPSDEWLDFFPFKWFLYNPL